MLRTVFKRSLSKISHIVCGPLDTNCYILGFNDRCLIIDPGAQSDIISSIIKEKYSAHPLEIYLTHGHFDHIGGVNSIVSKYPETKIYISHDDLPLLLDSRKNLSASMGIDTALKDVIKTVQFVEEGDVIDVGADDKMKVIDLPGHTKGSTGLYHAKEKLLFSGDTLFKESVGNTDLPGGDYGSLMNSVMKKLMTLPSESVVFPGHCESTTIGDERRRNPFVLAYKPWLSLNKALVY